MLMVNFSIKHGDFKNSYGTVYQRVQIIFQKIWMMRLQGLDTFSQRMDSRKGRKNGMATPESIRHGRRLCQIPSGYVRHSY